MMRSMFAGVSGLRSHQTMMDVVGHNIANVNTPGFKGSQITFQEALAQQVRGAAGSDGDQGGINPMDIGLGTRVASIDPVFSQGATQITGRATDLAIQGDGFFMLGLGSDRFYTRAGSFTFDEVGNLTAPDGLQVLGWTAASDGTIDTQGAIGKIQLPVAQVIDPQVTSVVEMGGNLSSDLAVGEVHNTSIVVYDSIGTGHELSVQFEKTAPNAWDLTATIDGTAVTTTPGSISFASDGTLSGATSIGISGFAPPGADPMAFTVDLAGTSPVVQFGGSSTAEAFTQDGQAIGFLRAFAVADDGTITSQFSNGETKVMAQVATATFNNPAGLARIGSTYFSSSPNSGEPLIGAPSSGNRGILSAGSLEMSNVDLAQEFTNLIIAQRGFQANTRVISALSLIHI